MHSSVLKRSRGRVLAGCVLATAALLGSEVLGQGELSPTINLFGDEIVQKLQGNGRIVRFFGPNGPFERAMGRRSAVEGYEHILSFHDGRQIRGSLLELTKAEIKWKRPDANATLVFPRGEVRRITLQQRSQEQRRGWAVPGLEPMEEKINGKPLGTVKLPGGDWLHGEVVSGSEGSLAVKIGDGPEFEVDRSSVEWLHLGEKPVPAFGFAGGNLDLESWSARGAGSRVEINEGVATVSAGGWIGRPMAPMQRFEMSFEIPAGGEDHTEIWLQPIGPEVNCYSTGTIVLRLGKKEFTHCVYTQQIQDVRTPIPPEDQQENASARYRVLYDGANQKLTVIRNGRQLGEWNFVDEKNPNVRRMEQQFQVNGICFQRKRGTNQPLQLSRLQVQPWMGDLEKAPPGQGDCVLWTESSAMVGTLGAVGRTDFFFSGAKHERTDESLLQFAGDPAPLPGADAVLLFGDQGELSAGDLEIRGGRVKCRTVFSSALHLPAGGLQVISFPSKTHSGSEAASDRLIFKNGDEIGGKLISMGDAVPVIWQMHSGQEIAFGHDAIAGIRLAKAPTASNETPMEPLVELRNGDLIRGEVAATDAASLSIRNAILGARTLGRDHVSVLLPNASLSGVDGGFQPDRWMNRKEAEPENQGRGGQSNSRDWVYLDGTYILQREAAGRMGSQMVSLSPPLSQTFERFELRCDVTDPSGNDPAFSISVREKQSVSGFQASFVYGRLQLFLHSSKPRGGPNWRHIVYDGKVKDATSRRRVRIFVDSKVGTADIYMDGILLTRVGQQPNERLPGIGGNIRIQGTGNNEQPIVFSNLWMGPWNGELPSAATASPAGVALTNGDFASGAPSAFLNGKIRMESDIGPLELPVNKIVSINFGRESVPAKAAARLRLVDGTSLHVDAFKCEGGKISAKSAVLGELNFEASALAEIVVNPPPVRPPQHVLAKGETQEPQHDEQADQ